jgi:2',3'-cyclic-nucleotide 2'-phosphodiesterase (5'-nucleotidase family)
MTAYAPKLTGLPIVFVQINDVYHIDARSDWSKEDSLILPRIATIVHRLRRLYGNDRVHFCLPGDFLAPSCLSKEFKGEQMVDILNAMGLDFVTFGNHEFEEGFTWQDVYARLEQSRFTWISTNFEFEPREVFEQFLDHKRYWWYHPIWLSPKNLVILLGVLLKSRYPDFGVAHDPITWTQDAIKQWQEGGEELRRARDLARDESIQPVFVVLTHLPLDTKDGGDLPLAKSCPDILLIMGGHDHDVPYQDISTRTLVVKALSNARTLRLNWIVAILRDQIAPLLEDSAETAAVLRAVGDNLLRATLPPAVSKIFFNKRRPTRADVARVGLPLTEFLEPVERGGLSGIVDSVAVGYHPSGHDYVFVFSLCLKMNERLTSLIPPDTKVSARIKDWLNRSSETTATIIPAPMCLHLEDKVVRRQSTNFGNFIADVVRHGGVQRRFSERRCDVGLINSGSFRLDRDIAADEVISQKTLCDIFFHKNSVRRFDLTGADLLSIIRQSLEFRRMGGEEGHGEFLQLSGLAVEVDGDNLDVYLAELDSKRVPIDPHRVYSVATTDYVSRKPYAHWFKGRPSTPLDPDVRSAVEAELSGLQTIGEMMPSFRIYLNQYCVEPRWVWKRARARQRRSTSPRTKGRCQRS